MRDKIDSFMNELSRKVGDRLPERKEVTDTLRKAASAIPFSKEIAATYYCAVDEGTPGRVKGVIAASLAYLVLPTDIVPDIIPAIGFTDDVSVLTTMFSVVACHVNEGHRKSARDLLSEDKESNPDGPAETRGA